MKDTHPEIEERFIRMIMEKSGEERLKMGFDMCETARKLVVASIVHDAPQSTDTEIKTAVFERLYKKDISPEAGLKVIKKIKGEK